jgi:hypothetical protein
LNKVRYVDHKQLLLSSVSRQSFGYKHLFPSRASDDSVCSGIDLLANQFDSKVLLSRSDGMRLANFGNDFTLLTPPQKHFVMETALTIVAVNFITQVATVH